MKNFFLICYYICFLYIWYQGFIFFLNFALDSNLFIVDDPRLWFVFLLALYNLEVYSKK
jgi:hypothetical protein